MHSLITMKPASLVPLRIVFIVPLDQIELELLPRILYVLWTARAGHSARRLALTVHY